MADTLKSLVSKKKKRFIDEQNNFNLDLTYIGTGNFFFTFFFVLINFFIFFSL